ELDSINLKEIIGYSIQSEEKSKQFYKKFVETGKGKLVVERFRTLMDEEQLHKETLLELHEKLYGNRNYDIPDNDNLPPHEDFESLRQVENLIDALEKAITNENNAIRIYEYVAGEYEEYSDLFHYLAAMEHGHYESLKREKGLYERGAETTGQDEFSGGIWKNLGLEGF
ncbi:ferritin family protein, partial [Candidatus Bipolaricaulota bacterium]|nr:ferritin family protein [Candidatus Bipolaricaulota bacterium]